MVEYVEYPFHQHLAKITEKALELTQFIRDSSNNFSDDEHSNDSFTEKVNYTKMCLSILQFNINCEVIELDELLEVIKDKIKKKLQRDKEIKLEQNKELSKIS